MQTEQDLEKEFSDLYDQNDSFNFYVNRYCNTYKLNKDEALKHKLVRSVGLYYLTKNDCSVHMCISEGFDAEDKSC